MKIADESNTSTVGPATTLSGEVSRKYAVRRFQREQQKQGAQRPGVIRPPVVPQIRKV